MPGRSRARAKRAAAVFACLLVTFALFAPLRAHAEGRVAFLAERLKYPPGNGQTDDFRVRANAAVALGATNDEAAVAPLCDGLADPSDVVRQAAAVALKRLSRATALDCLHARYAIENSAAVKVEIQRAVAASEAARMRATSGEAAPPYAARAKYYVAISPSANGTSRSRADVERIVRGSIASKLSELGEYQVAPPGESLDAAKAAIRRRKLKGYYLGVSVEKFDYVEGSLRVRLKIAVFSYPGRDLRGEVPAGATLPDAQPGDEAAEDQLMSVVAAHAAELFAQNFR
jgi:HEAT repeat protein